MNYAYGCKLFFCLWPCYCEASDSESIHPANQSSPISSQEPVREEENFGQIPQLKFNSDRIDIEKIFFQSKHTSEIELHNNGTKKTNFSLQPVKTDFGARFTLSPSQGSVKAGHYKRIEVSFLGCYQK